MEAQLSPSFHWPTLESRFADEFFKLLPEQKAPSATHISGHSFCCCRCGVTLSWWFSGTIPGPYPWGFFLKSKFKYPTWGHCGKQQPWSQSHMTYEDIQNARPPLPLTDIFIPLKRQHRIWSERQLQEFKSSVPIMAMSFDNDVTLGGWLHYLFVPQFPHL